MNLNKQSELSESLRNMIRTLCRDYTIFEGTVTGDIDETDCTCTVTVGDSQTSVNFSAVPLEILIGSKASVTCIPNLNSSCLLCFRDGDPGRPQLLKVDSVAKVYANPSVLWQFGKGQNGGLVLVNPLVVEENKAQDDLNTLKDLIAGWTPVPNDGGAALKAVLTTWLAEHIVPTVADDIQSTVITQ